MDRGLQAGMFPDAIRAMWGTWQGSTINNNFSKEGRRLCLV